MYLSKDSTVSVEALHRVQEKATALMLGAQARADLYGDETYHPDAAAAGVEAWQWGQLLNRLETAIQYDTGDVLLEMLLTSALGTAKGLGHADDRVPGWMAADAIDWLNFGGMTVTV
jgi:hypothetical protein